MRRQVREGRGGEGVKERRGVGGRGGEGEESVAAHYILAQ